MYVEDLPDRQMAAWLTGGEGTWIQTDPTWGRSYALVKAEIDDRFSALFLAHLCERHGELDTVYDGAGAGLVRAGLIDVEGDPDSGPIVYDPTYELIRAAAGIHGRDIDNPASHTLEFRRAVTAAAAVELMRARGMLVDPAELPYRHPHARIDAGFPDVRRAVYAGEQRPWHEDEKMMLAASVTNARAEAEGALVRELREGGPTPGMRLFQAVEGALRTGAIKHEESVVRVDVDLGPEKSRTLRVPANAVVSAAIDDSLRMLPYLAADGTFEGGDWLRGVDPGAVESVRYGRRQIYARAEREAPKVATTAQLKTAFAERDLARASAPATARTETIKRKGIK